MAFMSMTPQKNKSSESVKVLCHNIRVELCLRSFFKKSWFKLTVLHQYIFLALEIEFILKFHLSHGSFNCQ